MNKQAQLLLLALLATTLTPASLATPIEPGLAFGYSENVNWINFAPSQGISGPGCLFDSGRFQNVGHCQNETSKLTLMADSTRSQPNAKPVRLFTCRLNGWRRASLAPSMEGQSGA